MISAIYRRPEVFEHQGNPLLEALPPILGNGETLDLLTNLPPYYPNERNHSQELRIHYLDRLYDIIQAQPEHLQIATVVSRLIRHGYKSRNPLLRDYSAHAYQLATLDSEFVTPPPNFAKCRSGAYLTGLSGIGKTTIVERILATYPQTIVHEKYHDRQFTQSQVVWLKLDCPHDGSLKQLCLSFFSALDHALGGATDYYGQITKCRMGVEGYVTLMTRLCHTYHIGLLVIDELQHLTEAPRGGEKKTLNFLLNLMNSIGVPILLLGTFESASIFSKTFRNARRVSFAGPLIIDRYSKDDPRFRLLIETIWHYQWTKQPVVLDDKMIEAIYESSQGITDVIVNIYMLNQQFAILDSKEAFTDGDVRKAISNHCPILAPAINALRSGDKKCYEQFRELEPPADQWNRALSKSGQEIDLMGVNDTLVEEYMQRIDSEADPQKGAARAGEPQEIAEQGESQLNTVQTVGRRDTQRPDLDAHMFRPTERAKR